MIGLHYFGFNGSGPIGGLLTGWLCAQGGTELAFAVALAATAGVVLLRRPVVRTRLVPIAHRG